MTKLQQGYIILLSCIALVMIVIGSFGLYISELPKTEPIPKRESPLRTTITRQDDCTVIKTLLTDSQYIFVSVCDITVIGEE